jgi:hypothetical protein
VSIPLKALVALELDGVVYQPGEWISLPDGQDARATQLQAYGYVAPASAEPVKKTRRKTAPAS